MLEAIEAHPQQHSIPHAPEFKPFNYSPSWLVIYPINMGGFSPGYSKLSKLCEANAEAKNGVAAKQCLKIAQTLQQTSKTVLPRSFGFAMEANIQNALRPGSEEAIFAARRQAVARKVGMCAAPRHLEGSGKLKLDEATKSAWNNAYLQDLDSLGEIQAMQRAAEREYAIYPDQYAEDPRNCGSAMAMSSEEMGEFLGDLDPAVNPESLIQ